MSIPTVSVVMSVFNGERFLRESLESVLEQSYTDFEFIVIDDGSTDDSPAILETFQKKDVRINVYRQENRGLIDSLNRGVSLARGEYIARMDADDIAIQDRLKWQVDFLGTHREVGVLGGAVEFIDTLGRRICVAKNPNEDQEIQRTLPHSNVIWHPSVLLRKAAIVSVGGYRKIKEAEDYDLWLRMAEQWRMANLPQVVLKYRIHPAQVSVVRCRQQALGSGMARVAASMRREGKPDPVNPAQDVTEGLLKRLGVSEEELQTTLARGYLSSIRNLCRIGEYSLALEALKTMHSKEVELAEKWVISDSYLWKALIHWRGGNIGESILSVGYAIFIRPVVILRPLRLLLRELTTI